MRKTKSILFVVIIIASLFTVVPVAAKGKLEYKANGKITHYLPEVTSSMVLRGRWDLKIMNGVVDFKGYYHELNVEEDIEQSPAGTVDHFKLSFTDLYRYMIYDDGSVEVWGTIHYDKKYWYIEGNTWGVDPPGNAPQDCVEDFIVAWVKIRVDPNTGEFKMDIYPMENPPNGWNLFGTVL